MSTDYLLGRVNENNTFVNTKITETENQLLFTYRLLDEKKQKDLLWYANMLKQKVE